MQTCGGQIDPTNARKRTLTRNLSHRPSNRSDRTLRATAAPVIDQPAERTLANVRTAAGDY